MEEVVQLLTEKNICLKRFFEINEQELDFINAGNFDNLDRFYSAREGILEIIQRVDAMIEVAFLGFEGEPTDDVTQHSIRRCMEQKDNLVKRILAQDLLILERIESAKSEIIKDLSETKTVRKAISSYKSGPDRRKLDEEA